MLKCSKVLRIAGIFILNFFFLSCENFLNGSDLKDEIKREIFIANSTRPEITSAEPKFVDGGVYSDSNIIIVFSKPMEEKFFSDFSYISITDSSGTNLHEHYLFPKLSADGQTLTIAHNPLNYINVQDGTVKSIKVTLSNEISDLESIPLKNDYIWTFNINTKTDDKAPEFLSETTVNGNSSAAMEEGSFNSLIASLEADNFFTDTYHCNSINLHLNTYDAGSGVSKLTVKETLLYSADGLDVRDKNIFSETTFTNFTQKEAIYSFNDTYKFSKNFADGIVELTLTIEDLCGNKTEKTFAMVKDTDLTVSYKKSFADDANKNVTPLESNHYFAIDSFEPKSVWATWNGKEYKDNVSISATKLCYEDYSLISTGKLISNSNKALYYFEDIDTAKDCKLVTSFVDSIGNIKDYTVTIKKASVLLDIYPGEENSRPDYVGLKFSDHGKIISYYVNSDNKFELFDDVYSDDTSAFFIPKNTYACMRIDYSTYYEELLNFTDENMFMYFSDLYYGSGELTYLEWSDKTSEFSASVSIGKNEESIPGCFIAITILNSELLSSDTLAVTATFGYDLDFTSSYPIQKTRDNTLFVPINDLWQYKSGHDVLYIGLQAIKNETKMRSWFNIDNSGHYHIIDEQWYTFNLRNIIKESNQINDITAPSLNISENYYYSESYFSESGNPHTYCYISDPYWDDNSSLINVNEKIPLKIYYGKRSERELSLNEIKILSCLNLEVTLADNNLGKNPIIIPLTEFIDNIKNESSQHYDLFIFVEDKSGNFTYRKINYDFYKNNEYSVTYYEDSKAFSGIQAKTENFMNRESSNCVDALTLEEPEDSANTFLRVVITYNENNMNYEYPYYVFNTQTQCNTKNIIQNGKMLTVVHDQPVYIHTVTSPINFGDDIRSWENWTGNKHKLNKKIISTTGPQFDNYDYPALSEIPEGWYYAAIIYFADNTSTIGTVFQN